MLNDKIGELKKEIINYSNLVLSMIEKSLKGLLENDQAALVQVIELDEAKANNTELDIDEHCLNLIAQYQPKARDLRTILMTIKMNSDLERIADLCVNISKASLYLIDRPEEKPLKNFQTMTDKVINMLQQAISAYSDEDPELAQRICQEDAEVDELRDRILRNLVAYISDKELTIGRAVHLIKISRYLERVASHLERIADHVTNIAEDIVFMVKGKVIKHHPGNKEV